MVPSARHAALSCHPGAGGDSLRHRAFTRPGTYFCVFYPLAQLKGNATSNSYVQTIAFEKSKILDGTVCSTVSWGGNTPTATLREATVTIVKQRECIRHYPFLADNLICGHSGSAEKVSLARGVEGCGGGFSRVMGTNLIRAKRNVTEKVLSKTAACCPLTLPHTPRHCPCFVTSIPRSCWPGIRGALGLGLQ